MKNKNQWTGQFKAKVFSDRSMASFSGPNDGGDKVLTGFFWEIVFPAIIYALAFTAFVISFRFGLGL